jgi:hypothetical protein
MASSSPPHSFGQLGELNFRDGNMVTLAEEGGKTVVSLLGYDSLVLAFYSSKVNGNLRPLH